MTKQEAINKGIKMFPDLVDKMMEHYFTGGEEGSVGDTTAKLQNLYQPHAISYNWEFKFHLNDEVYFELKEWDTYSYSVQLFDGNKILQSYFSDNDNLLEDNSEKRYPIN